MHTKVCGSCKRNLTDILIRLYQTTSALMGMGMHESITIVQSTKSGSKVQDPPYKKQQC